MKLYESFFKSVCEKCMKSLCEKLAILSGKNKCADLKRAVLSINRMCADSLFHKSGAAYVIVLSFFKYFFQLEVWKVISCLLIRQSGGL